MTVGLENRLPGPHRARVVVVEPCMKKVWNRGVILNVYIEDCTFVLVSHLNIFF